MESKIKLISILWSIFIFGNIQASWFNSGGYSDCVIENTKKVTIKNAINKIDAECARKYSETIPKNELKKLDGKAGVINTTGLTLAIQLYNGTDYNLTNVVVEVEGGGTKKRIYSFDLLAHSNNSINPYSTDNIYTDAFSLKEKQKITWSIISAKGYKK